MDCLAVHFSPLKMKAIILNRKVNIRTILRKI